jgi:arylsulfatase A-like enzyme
MTSQKIKSSRLTRGFVSTLLALLLMSLTSAPFPSRSDAADPKSHQNILFIAVDDLNDWVGALGGHPQAITPNMDKLAERGLLFTNAHCTAPGCNASRTSLLMGLRPSTTGIYQNAHDWRTTTLVESATHLPQHFRNQGYKTLGAGKLFHAHTFFDPKYLSGFSDATAWDDYFPSLTQQMPAEAVPAKWPVNSSKKFYGGHFDWSPLQIETAEMADAKVVAWAKEKLSRTHEKPLFLSVGIYRPHVPWYAPQKYFDRFPLKSIQLPKHLDQDVTDLPEAARKMTKSKWHEWIVDNKQWKSAVQGYLASLSFADDMVGELLTALDNGPLAGNTMVILWGDHGYHLGEKQHWEKFALWENTTRVPLMVVAPQHTNPKTTCDTPVSLLDLYPTLIDLCDLEPPPQKLEGNSFVDLLKNPGMKSKRVAITTQGMNNHSVRSRQHRYIQYADGTEELYDHKNDPHEWTNLASEKEHTKTKKRLAKFIPTINKEPLLPPKTSDTN